MILQTDRVIVRHVYERKIRRFQSHEGWVINFINCVDHIIKDPPAVEHKTTIPSGHECQEIEVRILCVYYIPLCEHFSSSFMQVMFEREFSGQRDLNEMKEQTLKMVDFAMDLVDMAEECLDPENNI